MTKTEAIDAVGRSTLMELYPCSSQNISKWPEVLPLAVADRIRGMAVREQIDLPDRIKFESIAEQSPDRADAAA